MKGEALALGILHNEFAILDIVAYRHEEYRHKYGEIPKQFILSFGVYQAFHNQLAAIVRHQMFASTAHPKILQDFSIDPTTKLTRFRGTLIVPYQSLHIHGLEAKDISGKDLMLWSLPNGEIQGI